MRRACIDIGSNTTRLLVAETGPGQLLEVHQERAFTLIGAELRETGTIGEAKIAEVVQVVRAQLEHARAMRAETVHGVATAAIRRAANGDRLVEALCRECALEVKVLSGEEEARLAFAGAAGTLDHEPSGLLGVADVGGGSCELVVGSATGGAIDFSVSLPFGSGDVADGWLHSDPPTPAELEAARHRVGEGLRGVRTPQPAEAVAVGGSAASLRRLAGPVLDRAAFSRSLALLGSDDTTEVARRFALDRERVRLLPAGLLILQEIARVFGTPLQVGRGGVREGVLLEAGR